MIKPRYNAAGRPWVDRPQYGKLRNRPRGRRSRKPRREPRDAHGGGPSLCFQASCLFPRVQIASLQANLPFDYLYLAKSGIKRVSEGEEEVWKVMEMLVFPRWGWDFSFVADFRENINVNEIIANSDQNLNMRTLNFLSLCITFFFFKFCRSCFTSLFTTLPTENIRDGIKKQRRNRGCHRLKIICIPLLMPPPSPSSIPRVPSEGWNEQIPRTNGRYGIRGRKTRVRGNGRAVGWIKCRRRGEEETFAIIVIYDRVENEADLVEATALCRICRSSNGSAINILINYWLFILIIEKFTRKIYIYIQAS